MIEKMENALRGLRVAVPADWGDEATLALVVEHDASIDEAERLLAESTLLTNQAVASESATWGELQQARSLANEKLMSAGRTLTTAFASRIGLLESMVAVAETSVDVAESELTRQSDMARATLEASGTLERVRRQYATAPASADVVIAHRVRESQFVIDAAAALEQAKHGLFSLRGMLRETTERRESIASLGVELRRQLLRVA